MRTLFSGIDQLEGAMTFHRERHGVLAGNLANIDTPGFRPVDLERVAETPATPGATELARTDPAHLGAAQPLPHTNLTFIESSDAAGADGNAVSLEHEMAKLNANRVRYAASSELVSRHLALLRYGATDGSG